MSVMYEINSLGFKIDPWGVTKRITSSSSTKSINMNYPSLLLNNYQKLYRSHPGYCLHLNINKNKNIEIIRNIYFGTNEWTAYDVRAHVDI